jgi:hypothetical protein
MTRGLTEAQRSDIQLFSRLGWQQKKIAEHLNLKKSQVLHEQRKNGIRYHDLQTLSAAMKSRILALARNGAGSPRIARELNISQHRVSDLLREHGFRRKLTMLQARAIRREYRIFESLVATKHGCTVGAVARLLRRRKNDD